MDLFWRHNAWYRQKFGDVKRIKKQLVFNLDIVNTGSNSAYYGFDYANVLVKGANFAMRPQSLPQDLAMLKMFEGYIKPKGTILVPLGPFSSCYKTYSQNDLERYYGVWRQGLIDNFNLEKSEEYLGMMNSPMRNAPVQMIKGFARSFVSFALRRKDKIEYAFQPMSELQLESDAEHWIEGWKRQFKIDDLDGGIPTHILEGRKKRVKTLKEIIDFCKDREFGLVFVMPPITKYLSNKLSASFRKNYIYSFLEEAGAKDIPFLDYLCDDELSNPMFFFNSFFLNRKGRTLFTERVITDAARLCVR